MFDSIGGPEPLSRLSKQVTGLAEDGFVKDERLGPALGGAALHPSEASQTAKSVRIEPVLGSLASKVGE